MLPRVVLIVVCAFLWNVRDSTKAGFVKKIVGGLATEINKAPYQVSLELKNKGVFRHICGGSIINKDWIVTAAHCLVVVPKAKYRIRAGSTLLQNGGTLHSIRKYIKHVDFDEDTNDYDVAVMRVSPPFEFSDTIKAIELASAEPHFGKTALVTGWGHTSYNGSLSSHLKMIHLVITNKGVCNAIYQWSITSRMICASDGKNGRDSCTGDSGGPLTIDNKLVGIVSFGKGCARKGFPGVYTNVFVLKPWIENSIGDDTDYYYDTYALNGDTETRIVGGSPIEITKAPYQVSLELKQYGNFEHRCGASILSKQWVITAAHCIKGIAKDRFRIRAGSTFLETGGTLHYITSYTTHENYNRSGRDYDVAVMKLSEPFVYSDKVKPIPLATKEPMFGQQVWVSGWGRTAHRGSVSPQLRVVDLKIISRGPCNVPYQWQITPRMICALAPEGGKDSCQGDSGGPMVVNNQLVGIVSWGKKCAEKDVPGVYTNVKVFRGWIQNAIGLPITDGSPVPQWRATQNNGANSQCKGNRRCDWH